MSNILYHLTIENLIHNIDNNEMLMHIFYTYIYLYDTESRGNISKTKNARVVFPVHDTLSQCDACTDKVS